MNAAIPIRRLIGVEGLHLAQRLTNREFPVRQTPLFADLAGYPVRHSPAAHHTNLRGLMSETGPRGERVMIYTIVWEFRVRPDRIAEFEAAYGSAGSWAALFARAEGFIGVELLASSEEAGRYLTIDRWVCQAAFADFKATFAAHYRALDERLAGIATSEKRFGAFYGA